MVYTVYSLAKGYWDLWHPRRKKGHAQQAPLLRLGLGRPERKARGRVPGLSIRAFRGVLGYRF